ncbi:Split hand/foot malformation [Fasciola gigantica]|uniref:26S proteasome complex subunit SEM1 n=1 Tax=Fasciola gigantica TaxID=46835 RepID=A0A504Z2L9_FASGI|nr:Split hand/foot malformation [Fasciola gigantica]
MTKEAFVKSKTKDDGERGERQGGKVELGMLEEDDEFEEFVAHAWTGDPKRSEETTVWEDNWDDDVVDDEFTHQLRAEFQKQGKVFVVPEIFPTLD